MVEKESQAYIKELNESINKDRAAHGKKPLTLSITQIIEFSKSVKYLYNALTSFSAD